MEVRQSMMTNRWIMNKEWMDDDDWMNRNRNKWIKNNFEVNLMRFIWECLAIISIKRRTGV